MRVRRNEMTICALACICAWVFVVGCDGDTGTLIESEIVDNVDDNSETPDPFPARSKSAEILALEALFDENLDLPTYYSGAQPYRDVLLDQSDSGLSYTYYNIQGPLDGIISMFESSGRQDHFELALTLCENMVAAADRDRDNDGHPEWDGSLDGTPPSDGYPDQLLPDFQGAVGIVRLARVIVSDPGLNAVYGERATSLAAFVENHIVDKWLYTRNRLTWFRDLPNWSDKASMLVRMLCDLYVVTGDEDRRDLAEEFTNQFIQTVLVYDTDLDAYTWPTVPSPDTTHTNREAFFIDTAAQTGIVFTDTDVERVGNTVTSLIWNGSLADPRCANFHTGDNSPYKNRGPWEWGLLYDGWVRSGRVHPTVQAVCQSILDLTQTDPGINPTVSRSNHNAAVVAMSGHLARDRWINGQ